MGKTEEAKSEAAWRLAESQLGVITRTQLLDLGFSSRAIEHRLALRRLHRIYRGVYAVGWPEMTDQRRWMAAVLSCGPTAVLSPRSAGALWRMRPRGSGMGQIDVTVRRRTGPRRPRIRVRCRPALTDAEITDHESVPVTSPLRTLLDLATEISAPELEMAISEADKHGVIDYESILPSLEDHRGERGVARVREIFEKFNFKLSESQLEIAFRKLAEETSLPAPVVGPVVNGLTVDFFWPEYGLVVETDGLTYHRTAASQRKDRLRDQTHAASGLTSLRFTHWQVAHEPEHVAQVLTQTARHLESN